MCLVGDFFLALYESGIRLPFSVVPFLVPEINTFIYTVSSMVIILLYIYWLFLKGTLILCLRYSDCFHLFELDSESSLI
jgi:hypothetical protein